MEPLPFLSRLWFAYVAFFRVLFDGLYAAKLSKAGPSLALPAPAPSAGEAAGQRSPPPPPSSARSLADDRPKVDAALQLLALLQREGRFVDFLEEDVASFTDADIGAAARVVHAGCKKALREHLALEPVLGEDEGTDVTLEDGFSADEVKLTGNVQGKAPYKGKLRHRGWRAKTLTLPEAVKGHDAKILAQAEVEL